MKNKISNYIIMRMWREESTNKRLYNAYETAEKIKKIRGIPLVSRICFVSEITPKSLEMIFVSFVQIYF